MLIEIITIVGHLILVIASGVTVAVGGIILFTLVGALCTWVVTALRSLSHTRKQRAGIAAPPVESETVCRERSPNAAWDDRKPSSVSPA
jgi:hypothetical protein